MEKRDLAKAVVAYSLRNTNAIEDIHAGITPVSHTGDFSDVVIVDAAGNKIPWNKASRISQAEMKAILQTAVNRVYAVLTHDGDVEFEEDVLTHALEYTRGWDDPDGS